MYVCIYIYTHTHIRWEVRDCSGEPAPLEAHSGEEVAIQALKAEASKTSDATSCLDQQVCLTQKVLCSLLLHVQVSLVTALKVPICPKFEQPMICVWHEIREVRLQFLQAVTRKALVQAYGQHRAWSHKAIAAFLVLPPVASPNWHNFIVGSVEHLSSVILPLW